MELREFAERILFGASIEDKLLCPESITDDRPGPAINAPESPGRPAELRFKKETRRASDFPGPHRLESAQERGRLLHFFANHELLATELMALVLLRFPDAPGTFRRGVLQTLRDEQEHTRLYMKRMLDCGIDFGELPVSGYFWRAVSGMENPIDYVAGLSLTFEQANLDFAWEFSRKFGEAGDNETSQLLNRIYRDEIGHVAYGLKWFRRWKNPNETDWEAFQRQLKFPLSPQRAKGFTLNVEGRRAAGLDPKFIGELNVYSHSKGRTPSVFWFNPFAEGYIAKGKSFTPVKHQTQLALDLANLPQYLCRQDDVVVVPRRPSVEFLSEIKQAGFPLPEFVELSPRGVTETSLTGRKLAGLRPWAWGPDSVEVFGPLFSNLTGGRCAVTGCFNDDVAQLYSKSWSAQFLREVLTCEQGRANPTACLCPLSTVGAAVRSFEESMEEIRRVREKGHHRIVVKKPFGLAGQNALRLWEKDLTPSQLRWIRSALEQGKELVVEPWLERLMDFSVQLEMTERSLQLCGFTGLINDHRGQFIANWAEPNHERHLPGPVARQFASSRTAFELEGFYDRLREALERLLESTGFRGPLGIDAFVYRDFEGVTRVKPVVEMNPRYTMGRLTLELMRFTVPGSHGRFRLATLATVREQGFGSFVEYADALRGRLPLTLQGEPVPRIQEGFVCLNDPAAAEVVLAVFEVTRQAGDNRLGLPRVY